MTIRSNNDPRYSRRFLFMGIAVIGFMFYCLYDGFINYPAQRQQAHDNYIATGGKEEEWEEWANINKVRSVVDIQMQYLMAAVTGLIGLLLLSVPFRLRGTWIEMNDTGITSSWGQSFNFDQVESLDKRKWNKGIAKVTYLDGDRRRRFIIDDYKYDRHPTDEILYELESHIGADRITGGPPEPEKQAAPPTEGNPA